MKTFFAKILYFFKCVLLTFLDSLAGGGYVATTLKESIIGILGLILITGIVIGISLLVAFLKAAS